MQARKLARILNELIKKNPSLKYAEVCVDRKYASSFPEYDVVSVNEVSVDEAGQWNGEERQKTIIRLGKY